MAEAVRVSGLRELNLAFKKMNAELPRELKRELVAVGEPVRAAAESLAVQHISHIGDRWSRMRLGVTSKLVYVAPKARRRGRGTPRPNLATLLLKDSMEPALARNEAVIMEGLDHMLDRLGRKGGF